MKHEGKEVKDRGGGRHHGGCGRFRTLEPRAGLGGGYMMGWKQMG